MCEIVDLYDFTAVYFYFALVFLLCVYTNAVAEFTVDHLTKLQFVLFYKSSMSTSLNIFSYI